MTSNLASVGRVLASARTRAALSLGVVLAIGATGTFAYWTDSVTVSGTTFTAGTIHLQVNGATPPPAYTTLNLSNMVPGNSMAGVLTIKNTGTAPLKYTAATTATNVGAGGLGAALTIKVTSGAVTGTAPALTCGGAIVSTSPTLNGPLISPGIRLDPTLSQTLCVEVDLPAAAATGLQGQSTSVDFKFTGTSDLS